MHRRSKSPSRINDAASRGHHRRERPKGIRLKILEIISCLTPIWEPISRNRTRHRERDAALSLHGTTKSRHEPPRHPAREATSVHSRHRQSDRNSVTKPKGTLATPYEEHRRQDAAHLSKSEDGSDTDATIPDEDQGEYLSRESEGYTSEIKAHMDSEKDFNQDTTYPEDANDLVSSYTEHHSRADSDLESNVDTHSEPHLDSDSSPDTDSTSLAASQDDSAEPEDIQTPLETSISALAISVLNSGLTPEIDSTDRQDYRAGDIAWVPLEGCPTCPKGKWRTTKHRIHEDAEHSGQGHYFVICGVIPGDHGQPCASGFSCTSLSQRTADISAVTIRNKYLRLEGGQNTFLSSIEGGERIYSGEEADLFIQGPAKMPLETFVETKKPKSFLVSQFGQKSEAHPTRRHLEPQSLNLLLERTTWS
ncbi:hypothetical protein Daus18300_009872 [Diaporthe australafricana]|uniref:Uncharacterized protein n=1 Tax=Diaporthe australafricana TaxID=127596 RepID=A0ABR3WCC4_9PEZI